jgi:hypothetical protein
VLPGRFAAEAASCVLSGRSADGVPVNDALAVLSALVDKSLLLVTSPVATRTAVSDVRNGSCVRSREVEAEAQRDDAIEGLVRYCLTESARAEAGLVGPDQWSGSSASIQDFDNYREALTWLVEARPAQPRPRWSHGNCRHSG